MLEQVSWGSHFCHFYRTQADLIDVLVPFFRAGLANNERCLWITSSPLPRAAARAALRALCPELEAYEQRGQLEIVDYDEWYLRTQGLAPEDVLEAWLEQERAALAAGFDGLRITGNTSFLSREQWASFAEYEAAVHSAFHDRRIIGLCSYSLDRCSASDLLDVLRNHGFALLHNGDGWGVVRSATELLGEMRLRQKPREAQQPELRLLPDPNARDTTGHQVRFYEAAAFPADAVAAFLAQGITRGGAALSIATPRHRDEIARALAALPLDLVALRERGQLVELDAAAILAAIGDGSRISHEFEETVERAVREVHGRHGSVHVFGEVVDLLCRRGREEEALALEAFWNELRSRLSFPLLCAYDYANFASEGSRAAFTHVCGAHGEVQSAPSAAGEVNVGNLLAHYQQQNSQLREEVTRRHKLEWGRAEALDGERDAIRRANEAHRHLALLQQLTSALSEAVSAADVIGIVRAHIVSLFQAEEALLVARGLADGEGSRPALAALCQRALRGRRFIYSRADGSELERGEVDRPAIALVAPLGVEARWTGALGLMLREERVIGESERALLDDTARQLTLALDRVFLYEHAQQAWQRAEEANRAKDQFLAMLGHELRNPLAPIVTALSLMDRRSGEEPFGRERKVIARQVKHMVCLVDDLLDVSRITRGTIELHASAVETAELVARAVEVASPLFEERAQHLSLSVPERGLCVHADPVRITQALSNLLTNAAKYTPKGGAISVSARLDGDDVLIDVRDDGAGIDAALLPHVFEMFVQTPQAIDRARGGLGLGLFIVRRLVELHGGSVQASSPGRGLGSTFSLRLPRVATVRAEGASAKAAPMRPVAPDGGGVRVLVVDDNADAAQLIAELMEESGHATRVAFDGPSALAIIDQGFVPDAAILDIGLPVVDGYELAALIKQRLGASGPAMAAVTGYGQSSDRARALEAGFDAHFVKPVDGAALLRYVAQRSARREAGE